MGANSPRSALRLRTSPSPFLPFSPSPLPPPEELATDAISELEGAVEELNAVLALLENGKRP